MPEYLAKLYDQFLSKLDGWALLGLVGQTVFTARFFVQWVASERAKRSVIPLAFWYLSLVGSAVLLLYATVRADPVFMLAYVANGFIYTRNLMLIRRERLGRAEAS